MGTRRDATFCPFSTQLFDAHPSVKGWASEAIKIPYAVPEIVNGVKRVRQTIYIPDFFVIYVDKNAREHKELLEVKPKDETPWFQGKPGRNRRLKEARQIMNQLKWQAALQFCQRRGWSFRVATEDELFAFNKKNK